MTIKKKLIGYGYTDSNGVATLDYDKNGTEISTLAPTGNSGYIGKGVGSVQLEAGLHSSETVVSEPCNVLDAKIYDDFETSYNGILNMNGSGISIEISDEWHKTGSKSAKCVISTSWIGWGQNPPSSFIGSTVNFKLDYKATNNGQFVALYQKNGEWIYDKTIKFYQVSIINNLYEQVKKIDLYDIFNEPLEIDSSTLILLSWSSQTIHVYNIDTQLLLKRIDQVNAYITVRISEEYFGAIGPKYVYLI